MVETKEKHDATSQALTKLYKESFLEYLVFFLLREYEDKNIQSEFAEEFRKMMIDNWAKLCASKIDTLINARPKDPLNKILYNQFVNARALSHEDIKETYLESLEDAKKYYKNSFEIET